MNNEVFAVLLFWGLIRDRRFQLSFPFVSEFIAATRVTLGRCSLPPGWPSLAVTTATDPEVLVWCSAVVVWRRARKREWTAAKVAFISQLVACMKHNLKLSGRGELIPTLRRALIAEFDQLLSVCIYPVRERLNNDVEGFSDLPLDYSAISLTLAQALVHGHFPGTRKSLPDRFSLGPWIDQGYQYSIEDVVRTIVYGAIHRRSMSVSEERDERLFSRLMTGAIRQGLFVYYLEHVHRPSVPFAMARFLAVRCHNNSPTLLAVLLHQSAYMVGEKTGVQCLQCQSTYRWHNLDPLTWGCNCGLLPVYCPVCKNSNGAHTVPLELATQHVLVEKRRLVLCTAP